ncbi:DUF4286 family protein [Pigmentiphaga litoralis]|uniref:EthD domain-containing protein n=1 Tax=Pigmentiphaga litoralis TaxID=516702 RepID=A0A7Y9IYZ9_9BURK|nr:DUF4286 family protein [Pigmentiphaga litoralis]NYE26494.1 hypothetical protein [Pigmentiphaga litoralis]NYE85614.1 hypothetical protein [Pigmentiphaga litoralis]
MPRSTHLVKILGRALDADALRQLSSRLVAALGVNPIKDALASTQSDDTYLILDRADIDPALFEGLRTETVELTETTVLPGKSAGQPAPFHYIVETDIAPDAEGDMNAWYEQEHLPGLAAVEGNVLSRRLVAAQGSPRYYACYDLVDPSARQTAAWTAVTATPWSSRVRPSFRNTRRTIFARLPLASASASASSSDPRTESDRP